MGNQMSRRFLAIPKEDLGALVEDLARSYTLLTPITEGGVTRFAAGGGGLPGDIPALTKRPLKEMFFPKGEVLFAFDPSGKVEAAASEDGPSGITRVAFGVRPCDARSLTLLDLVFDAEDYKDPYYVSRRQNTAIVTLACHKPGIACFCTSLGGGPFDETGSDVMFIDAGETYLVKVLTGKGERVLNGLRGLREAGDADLEAAQEAEARSRELANGNVPVEAGVRGLAGAFADPAWEDVYRKCLGCAVCTYLCPTCHCFDIGDEAVDVRGERVRNWDSCMFPLFTLHASGHNPRPSRKERFRQRIMHKFNYFVENNGCVACVGCGRCVENCPVNLDVRKVLEVFASSCK
ncbi:MAG: 4Fe-4S dicluster domain-containing protein [Bacillota bacterium]